MQDSLKVALVSLKTSLGDIDANLQRHKYWLERGLGAAPTFIGFPEFGLTGWVEDPKQALALGSTPVREVERWARKHGVFIGFCLVEKREGKLYNAAEIAGPEGRVGVMRKVNLIRRESVCYEAGRHFPVFDVAGCKMGVTTCADATRYEMLNLLSLRGAEVIFAPHANSLGVYGGHAAGWLRWRKERWPLFAKDCSVYILGCNNAGLHEKSGPEEERTKYCGGAAAFDFQGRLMAKAPSGRTCRECLITAELDLAALRAARKQNNLLTEFRPSIVYNRKSGWVLGRV
jgi:predicted amidohydrolase